MDGDVYIKGGEIRFGTLTVSGGTVTVIPPKRNWREEIREWLQDVYLIIKVIGGAIRIGLRIAETFSKVRLRGAKPHAAAYPSTS